MEIINRIRSFRPGVVLWMRLRHSRSELHFVPWMNQEILSCTCLFSSEKYFVPVSCFLLFNLSDWGGRSLTAVCMRVSPIIRTGYRIGNMAVQPFFSSGHSSYCSQPHKAQKHL